MRVLIVSPGLLPIPPESGGGVEWCIYHLAKHLPSFGAEVILAADIGMQHGLSSVRTYPVRGKPVAGVGGGLAVQSMYALSNYCKVFAAAKRALDAEKVDIIHVHDTRGNVPGLLLAGARGRIPIIATVHGPTPWMVRYRGGIERCFRALTYRLLDLRFLRAADWIVTVNQDLAHELLRLGVDSQKVSTISNGVDTDPELEVDRSDNRGSGYIMCVAQLTPRKGIDILIRAMAHVRREVRLVVAGQGPELPKLKRITRELGLDSRVRLLGSVERSQLFRLYRRAQAFVLPSFAEGTPLALLEAIGFGLPVVTTDIPGVRDYIQSGENGFLVPPGDVVQLANAIGNLSQLSRRHIDYGGGVGLHTWTSIAERYIQLYESVLAHTSLS